MHGWIILDKPLGLGSTQAVAAVKRNLRSAGFGKVKVGHGGTLDPLATGVLPIALGEATKLCGRMLDASKTYDFTICFGTETSGLDAEGEVVATSDVRPTLEQVQQALAQFTGPIEQIPPAYSAIKIDGKRAYARVRDGEDINIPARSVMIHDLEIVEISALADLKVIDVKVRVVCSAGTYIRALARDIGEQLGVGGHLTELRRTRSGVFDSMVTLAELQENPEVMDLATAVKTGFQHLVLSEAQTFKAVNGVRLSAPTDLDTGHVGLISPDGRAVGLFDNSESVLHPLVVFATNE